MIRVVAGERIEEFDFEMNFEGLSAEEDLIIQLDTIGDTVSLSAGRPGDPQPEPQVVGTGPAFTSGTTGLVFSEDEDFSSGESRWSPALLLVFNDYAIINKSAAAPPGPAIYASATVVTLAGVPLTAAACRGTRSPLRR